MIYAQFKTILTQKWNSKKMKLEPCAPRVVDACGSDSVFRLDGRNNINNMIFDTEQRMNRLKNVQSYLFYDIVKGSKIQNNNQVLYKNY